MESDCEGCLTYRNFQYNKCVDTKIERCPCRNCLVKVVCEWACDKLRMHREDRHK